MRRSGTAAARRLDAVRNEERIVEAALRLLAVEPYAGMDEIARAGGVGRATLYRHFSTREELVEALRARAGHETAKAMRRSRLREGSAAEALERLFDELIEVSDRYQFLVQIPEPADARRGDLTAQFLALIRRGQEAGEFGAAAPAEWWAELVRAALVCATRAVADGESKERAVGMAKEAVLAGLRGAEFG